MNNFIIQGTNIKIGLITNIDNLDTRLKPFFDNYLNIFKVNHLDDRLFAIRILYDNTLFEKYKINKDNIYRDETLLTKNVNSNVVEIILKEQEENEIIFLKRFILNCYARMLERDGTNFLHASSICVNNKAIIFVGDRGTGKTTNILNFLAEGKCSYVSNDKIGLQKDDHKLLIYGFPSKIGIRISTIEQNPILKQKLKSYFNNEDYKHINGLSLKNNCNEKLSLDIRHLKEALNITSNNVSELGAIIITEYNPNFEKTELKKISHIEALRQIKNHLISSVYEEQSFINSIINNDTKLINSIDDFISDDIKIYKLCQNGRGNDEYRRQIVSLMEE